MYDDTVDFFPPVIFVFYGLLCFVSLTFTGNCCDRRKSGFCRTCGWLVHVGCPRNLEGELYWAQIELVLPLVAGRVGVEDYTFPRESNYEETPLKCNALVVLTDSNEMLME